MAEALAILPQLKEELAKGLSFSAARELTRVAMPDTEATWIEAAAGKNLREVEQMVSGQHAPTWAPSRGSRS